MIMSVRAITKASLQLGLIPKVCPVCLNPTDSFQIHHWGDSRKIAEELGNYRRLCASCNKSLGVLFGKSYPDWDIQYGKLSEVFREYPGTYPNFDGIERGWSLVSELEVDRARITIQSQVFRYQVSSLWGDSVAVEATSASEAKRIALSRLDYLPPNMSVTEVAKGLRARKENTERVPKGPRVDILLAKITSGPLFSKWEQRRNDWQWQQVGPGREEVLEGTSRRVLLREAIKSASCSVAKCSLLKEYRELLKEQFRTFVKLKSVTEGAWRKLGYRV